MGLPFCVRNDINAAENECLWIEIARAKCKPTLICCAYRAPDADFGAFICNLHSCFPAIDLDKSDLLFLGDLNVNMLRNSRSHMGENKSFLIKESTE